MKIKNIKIDGKFILAPMAGVTDKAFRYICKEQGAALTVSEMISAKALTFNDKKTLSLMEKCDNENPYVVQTFGSDPDIFKQAIPMIIEASKCDIIDINMGCPAPKITTNGEGSALMKTPELAEKLIKAAVSVSTVPITVKFRKGFTNLEQNYLDFGKMAEQAGASAVCLHGRTRTEMYSGHADWDSIAKLKQSVSIPVIANGDVVNGESARDILTQTGADFAMIGRGTFGNPFIFEECNKAISGQDFVMPSLDKKLDVFVRQMELAAHFKSEKIAMLEARKHFIWYLKGVNNSRIFKDKIAKLTNMDEMYSLVADIKNTLLDI
ncbi:MAG: tRNA dihydrouridine synthase DusB [Clostridia bacterium]